MTDRDNLTVKRIVGESFEEKLEKAPHLKQCSNCGHTWKPRGQRKGSKQRQQRCSQCHTRRVN
jgi:DNA-directed RNA polymerase subunit RPC12/RpoP